MAGRILFIDRLPFRAADDAEGGRRFDPVLPLFVTPPEAARPDPGPDVVWPLWAFDTCFAGDALTSTLFLHRHYGLVAPDYTALSHVQLPGQRLRLNGFVDLNSEAIGSAAAVPQYFAKLWLLSNVTGYADRPYPLIAPYGICARAGRKRSIVGRRPFLASGITIEMAFDQDCPALSLWIPTEDY